MPTLTHAPAVGVVLLAFVAALTSSPGITRVPAASSFSSPGDAIASRALVDLDTYQGQCYTWMEQVVSDALGVDVGNDYRQSYFEAGFVEVTGAEAVLGDIIQIDNDADTTAASDFPGLHTLIIILNAGSGIFTGVDANQDWDGMVRFREDYDPAAQAARYPGGAYHIYHFAGASSGSSGGRQAPTPSKPGLGAGSTAVTNTPPPDPYLRMRAAPGLRSEVVALLPNGSELAVTGEPLLADGYWWLPASSSGVTGWVAAPFLIDATPPGSRQSTYTVAPGDTLNEIAARFGVSAEDLASANGIDEVNLIQAGTILGIPGTATAAAARGPASRATSVTTYVVAAGDTLSGIADRFGVDIRTLLAANSVDDPNLILVGSVLTIP